MRKVAPTPWPPIFFIFHQYSNNFGKGSPVLQTISAKYISNLVRNFGEKSQSILYSHTCIKKLGQPPGSQFC